MVGGRQRVAAGAAAAAGEAARTINGTAPDRSSSNIEESVCFPEATRILSDVIRQGSPAGTFVVRVEDLVYAGCHFAGVRSTFCDRIHLFGSRIRIDGEVASGMRPDTAHLWKTERVSISNQECISQHACGHWSTIHDAASQLPRSRQSFVILLSGSRLRGCAARSAVCATSGDRYHSTKS